jgi:5-methylcytosine-specific restriction endonuclease McrA
LSKRNTCLTPDERNSITFRARDNLHHQHKKPPAKKPPKKDLTEDQWIDTLEFFQWECAYCGDILNLGKDHVVPQSKGGPCTKWNIIPACYSCNQDKRDQDIEEWYRKQYFFSEERLQKIYRFMTLFGGGQFVRKD